MLLLYIMLLNPTDDHSSTGIALILIFLSGVTLCNTPEFVLNMPHKINFGKKYNASLYIACVVVVASKMLADDWLRKV